MSFPALGPVGGSEGPRQELPRGRFVVEELPPEKMVVTLKFKGNELVVPKPDWRTTVTDLVRAHGKVLGLPLRSCPMANGIRVMDGYQPRFGDVISFVELGPCEV